MPPDTSTGDDTSPRGGIQQPPRWGPRTGLHHMADALEVVLAPLVIPPRPPTGPDRRLAEGMEGDPEGQCGTRGKAGKPGLKKGWRGGANL